MTLIKAFEKEGSSRADPMRLLPRKLRTAILVYKAGVESGLIDPIGMEPAEPEETDDGEAADLG